MMPAAAPADPPRAPCTAFLSRRLARRVTQIYDAALSAHGLTIGQFGILANLRRRTPVGMTALAERLSSDASTVSRLLKPLIAGDLVAVARDAHDGRAKAIRLTDTGRERVIAARPAWEAAQADVVARLGAERCAALRFLLNDAFTLL